MSRGSRRPITAPGSSSDASAVQEESSALSLLFPEVMNMPRIIDALERVGFPSSHLVSQDRSGLVRLYRLHACPRPRRTLGQMESDSAREWAEEMDLGVPGGASGPPRTVFGGGGSLKRKERTDSSDSSSPVKRGRPEGGGDRLKPPPPPAAAAAAAAAAATNSTPYSSSLKRKEPPSDTSAGGDASKKSRSAITWP